MTRSTANKTQVDKIRIYLESIGHWREEFLPTVCELVELRSLRADAVARAAERPTVVGHTGQPRDNPAHATAIRLQGEISRLENSLLLTPRSAKAAGVKQEQDPLEDLFQDDFPVA